ncbi:uncharacterized protein RAG0_08364 [Rhynchosporium agropyri]|uniref:Uncharacterized protein n=1 Tax=Rhynchosporium agropyri TaxID=914238 RepID=A0A1E1KQH6_9HELO|nr:uncharacterized protein RAG0_08364 [Rhynchosporium agropyri]
MSNLRLKNDCAINADMAINSRGIRAASLASSPSSEESIEPIESLTMSGHDPDCETGLTLDMKWPPSLSKDFLKACILTQTKSLRLGSPSHALTRVQHPGQQQHTSARSRSSRQ